MLNNGIYLHLVKIWIFFKKIPNFLGSSVLNGAQVLNARATADWIVFSVSTPPQHHYYWPAVTTWNNICLVTTAQVFLHDYSSTWCQNVIRSLAVFLARRQISCCCCLIEKKFGRKFSYSAKCYDDIEFLRLSVCLSARDNSGSTFHLICIHW